MPFILSTILLTMSNDNRAVGFGVASLSLFFILCGCRRFPQPLKPLFLSVARLGNHRWLGAGSWEEFPWLSRAGSRQFWPSVGELTNCRGLQRLLSSL